MLLNKAFSLKDLGQLHYFLGIEVHHTTQGLLLSQTKYIAELLEKAKMSHANSLPTPMISGLQLFKYKGDPFVDRKLYRRIVGALQYVTITRLEIAFSVNKVIQFMQSLLNIHWNAVKRILRYLQGTIHYELSLSKSKKLDLTSYLDVDWANDLDD